MVHKLVLENQSGLNRVVVCSGKVALDCNKTLQKTLHPCYTHVISISSVYTVREKQIEKFQFWLSHKFLYIGSYLRRISVPTFTYFFSLSPQLSNFYA